MKQVKRPSEPTYKDTKVQHYELTLCGGSVERKHLKVKVGV